MTSTRDLGEQVAKIALETAARENATYADIRVVNTMIETVSVINENPASEESNDLGAGIRVLYSDSGWGFADTDDLDLDNVRETTRKALSLAKGAAHIGSKFQRAKEPVPKPRIPSPSRSRPSTKFSKTRREE